VTAAVISTALSLATPHGTDGRTRTDGNGTDAEVPLVTPRLPLLTAAELLTLQYYARDSMYVEWGSGASTTLVAPLAHQAVSIENQKAWCDEMLASADVDFWIQNNVLTYVCVDTGPTGAFGTPTGDANPENFSRYLSALDEADAAMVSLMPSLALQKDHRARSTRSKRAFLASSRWPSSLLKEEVTQSTADGDGGEKVLTLSTNTFTVVLVDGRFRVACALKALWHLDHSRGVLLIHDWTQRKEEYHAPILKRYKLVTVIDRLAVLIPSSPNALDEASDTGDDDKIKQELLVRQWWLEAAAELHAYSRNPARLKK